LTGFFVYFRQRSSVPAHGPAGCPLLRFAPSFFHDEGLIVTAPRLASRTIAILLMLAGLVVAILAIFADTLGYGTGRGFGYYQMIILIGGIVIALVGVAMLVNARVNREPTNEFEPEP